METFSVMTQPHMDYDLFLKTLKSPRVHRLRPQDLPDHSFKELNLNEPYYLLSTSGSENKKFYLHALSSIEQSCKSFFKSFDLSPDDKWGLCLSTSHVAGFSILCRSYFGGLKRPVLFSWNVENLVETLKKEKITLLSLVPTQVFDLCQKKILAPTRIKAVFVGGSALSPELLKDFKSLGWPAVPCYGSTETFAQMSQSIDGLGFEVFKGWEFKVSEKNELLLKGPGLYAYFFSQGIFRPRDSIWHPTGDRVEIDTRTKKFKILGKIGSEIKIKGSYFDFALFKQKFSNALNDFNLSPQLFLPLALEEGRNGSGLYMASCTKEASQVELLLSRFSDLRGCFFVDRLPRSEIGKIKKMELQDVLLRRIVSL